MTTPLLSSTGWVIDIVIKEYELTREEKARDERRESGEDEEQERNEEKRNLPQ